MTQDFAKIKPEPLLERKPVTTPPAWSLMFTGMIVGLAVGVLGCVLFYLSGNVPALNLNANSPVSSNSDLYSGEEPQSAVAAVQPEFEFYTELSEYEVIVDATPVDFTEEQVARAAADIISSQTRGAGDEKGESAAAFLPNNTPTAVSIMLQAGAFEQQGSANLEMQRQQALGLNVTVKQQALPGRLFLVQSGPYTDQQQLSSAEQLLRSNNISSIRLLPR